MINNLFYVSIFNDVEGAKLMIERGDDVNVKDIWGMTPLHLASIYNSVDVAKLLREHGAIEEEEQINEPKRNI